jgi:hypothetical protein
MWNIGPFAVRLERGLKILNFGSEHRRQRENCAVKQISKCHPILPYFSLSFLP